MIRVTLLTAALAATLAVPAHAGDIEIHTAWSRATPGAAPNGAGYMTLVNTGAEDRRLTAASAGFAARVELHTHIMDGDVMRMREVEGGVDIPAGETVVFKPGGLHIMLMGLSEPLKKGEARPVTLTFANGETRDIMLDVQGIGARGPAKAAHDEMKHGEMKHGEKAHHGHGE